MITKIKRIKKLGLVFEDYQADAATPPFKRFNVIFGWNGSGKSTLSTLFDLMANPSSGSHTEYICDLADGTELTTGATSPRPIRVFNQDYIDKNVNIVSGNAKAITVLLGEASQELHQQIEADERLLYGESETSFGLVVQRDQLRIERERALDARAQVFTAIAKTIGAVLGGSEVRGYRKPDAERDFGNVVSTDLLNDKEVEGLLEATKRSVLPVARVPGVDVVRGLEKHGTTLSAQILGLLHAADGLLNTIVESKPVERLAAHPDIASWVERGVELHTIHNSSNCEYCRQVLSGARVTELQGHFSASDRSLKSGIDAIRSSIKQVRTAVADISRPSPEHLYGEFQTDAKDRCADLSAAQEQVDRTLEDWEKALDQKKSNSTAVVPSPATPGMEKLLGVVAAVAEIVTKHNATTARFEQVRSEAAGRLKKHYLASVAGEVAEWDKAIADLQERYDAMSVDIDKAKDRVSENQAKVSSAHKGCDELNRHLALFLGHKELTFVPNTERSGEVAGYDIVRGDEPVTRLSEGEKTAIALVYFAVHLDDGYFDLPNGIVVVDDPISSLDSNSLYQAFSVLKNAVKDAKQVFIFTHNFDFLKLLLNWLQTGAGNQSEFFLLKNVVSGVERRAHLGPIDPTLKKYQSEYQYLFKLLKSMQGDQDGTIAKAYPVPNIARKLWETFLMFEVPNSDSPYRKMTVLKEEGFDEEKLDAIHKFINDQSHLTGGSFDPALVPGVQKAITNIFDVMREVSPRHFRIMDVSTN